MDLNYEAKRFALIGPEEARRYMKVYRMAARGLVKKHKHKVHPYRALYIESAMSFRHLLRTQG